MTKNVLSRTGNEAELVRRAKARDSAVWSFWYDEYYRLIYRYILARLGEREDAEDLASQTFLAALKSIDRFRYRGRPVVAWLYGIAHKLVAERLRSRTRRAKAEAALRSGALFDAGPESGIQRLDLINAINCLTPDQREVIVLRFLLSIPTKEVAVLLGKKDGAIASLQVRAVAALRRQLAAHDGLILAPLPTPVSEPKAPARVARALMDRGIALGAVGRSEDAIRAYGELFDRFRDCREPALRELVAQALVNRGARLNRLGRHEEAVSAYDEVVRRFDGAEELTVQEAVAKALLNRATSLKLLGRTDEVTASCDALRQRFRGTPDPILRGILDRANAASRRAAEPAQPA